MTLKVLVVDDSAFFRRRVTEILNAHPKLEVIGDAADGKAAIEKTATLRPDVITMDIEMPVMDGITAVKKIMATTPTPILMFSSLTHEGATATLDALEAGALDFLPKKFEDIAKNRKDGTQLLQDRVCALAQRAGFMTRQRASTATPTPLRRTPPREVKPLERTRSVSNSLPQSRRDVSSGHVRTPTAALARSSGKSYKLLAIGTSTGGPVALQKVLMPLPANIGVPIILVQHMPAAFTPAFATRLNSLCNVTVKEAEHGEYLRPGVAYLAPGGKQMLIEGRGNQATINIMEDDSARITYKPSVDLSFGSAAKVFSGDVLGLILTGMGADGREGSRMLKQRGAKIWAQDEASCVVYGMPQAVTSAGISEQSIALEQIAPSIISELNL